MRESDNAVQEGRKGGESVKPEGSVAPPQSHCQAAEQMTGSWGRVGGPTSVVNGPADANT